MEEALRNRLKKLHTLASRGIDGERANAEKILADLLEQHGLTMADLGAQQATAHKFSFDVPLGQHERQLFAQVVMNVLKIRTTEILFDGPRNAVVKCSISEKIEIELAFLIYLRELSELLAATTEAFVHTNKIYPPPAPEKTEQPRPRDAEREGLVGYFAKVMNHITIRPALEAKPR